MITAEAVLLIAGVPCPIATVCLCAATCVALLVYNNNYSTLLLTCFDSHRPILIRYTTIQHSLCIILFYTQVGNNSLTSGKYQGIPSDYTRQCSCAIRGGAVCVYANVILLLCAGWVVIVTMSVYR